MLLVYIRTWVSWILRNGSDFQWLPGPGGSLSFRVWEGTKVFRDNSLQAKTHIYRIIILMYTHWTKCVPGTKCIGQETLVALRWTDLGSVPDQGKRPYFRQPTAWHFNYKLRYMRSVTEGGFVLFRFVFEVFGKWPCWGTTPSSVLRGHSQQWSGDHAIPIKPRK